MSFPFLPAIRRAGLVLTLACLACASDPKAGGPGTYRGVLVSQSETGILEVTVGAATGDSLPASGTIEFPGRTVSMTGTLDQSQKTLLTLTSADGHQLTGQSRKEYAFGSFLKGQEYGTFALFFAPADGTPVQLFCGNLNLTSATGAQPLPFAAAAVASGIAICAAPTLTVFGTLDSANTLACSSFGASFDGQINVDAGGQWGTGENYGTWTLAPCSAESTDGGVVPLDGSAASGEDGPTDAGVDSLADAGADSPKAGTADADPTD